MKTRVIYTRAPRRSWRLSSGTEAPERSLTLSETLPPPPQSTCEYSTDHTSLNNNNNNNNNNKSSSTYNSGEFENNVFCDGEKHIKGIVSYSNYPAEYKDTQGNYNGNINRSYIEPSYEEIYSLEDNSVVHAIKKDVSRMNGNRQNSAIFGEYNNNNSYDCHDDHYFIDEEKEDDEEEEENDEDVPRIAIIAGKRNDERVRNILYGVSTMSGATLQRKYPTAATRTTISTLSSSWTETNRPHEQIYQTSDISRNGLLDEYKQLQQQTSAIEKRQTFWREENTDKYTIDNQDSWISELSTREIKTRTLLQGKPSYKEPAICSNEPISLAEKEEDNNNRERTSQTPKRGPVDKLDWTPTQGQFNSNLWISSSVMNTDDTNDIVNRNNHEKNSQERQLRRRGAEPDAESYFFNDERNEKIKNFKPNSCGENVCNDDDDNSGNRVEDKGKVKNLQMLSSFSNEFSPDKKNRKKKIRFVVDANNKTKREPYDKDGKEGKKKKPGRKSEGFK